MGVRAAPALLFVHGLSGSLAELARAHPPLRRATIASSRSTCPASGTRPMPPWEISIEAYGRLLARLLRRGRASATAPWSATRWAASSPPRPRSPSRTGSRSWCWSPRPGSRMRGMRTRAGRGRRRGWPRPPRRSLLRLQERGAAPTAAALTRPSRGSSQQPERLRTELLWEQFHDGAGTPGLPAGRPGRWSATTSSTGSSEVEVPTLIVWGRNDRIVPPSDAARLRPRLRNSRTVIFDRHRPLPAARAPGALQPPAGDVPGGPSSTPSAA